MAGGWFGLAALALSAFDEPVGAAGAAGGDGGAGAAGGIAGGGGSEHRGVRLACGTKGRWLAVAGLWLAAASASWLVVAIGMHCHRARQRAVLEGMAGASGWGGWFEWLRRGGMAGRGHYQLVAAYESESDSESGGELQ